MYATSRSLESARRVAREQRIAALITAALAALCAQAQVNTTPTLDPTTLRAALNPTGLTIDAVTIHAGVAGQFGTFNNFELRPVTIRPGIVLSSGNVADLGPIPGATDPGYDPSSPPAQVNSQMTPEPDAGGTAEFDLYGFTAGNIENFSGSFDVAAVRIDFTLDVASPVKFDFLFGSVEFPFWTSQFTDAFLVFLDGAEPANQITFDPNGNAVQVGSSFAGLETTADLNSAFSYPHGLIHHLTTTTATLPDGEHFLIFEVGDVNDHILDSAVFIADLRAEAGNAGTEPSEDPPYVGCPHISVEPVDATVCTGDPVSFSIVAAGDEPLRYQWQKDGVPIDSAANPTAATRTLMLVSVQASDAGVYRCKAINDCGDEKSDPATLTVIPCRSPGDMNCDGIVDFFDIDPFLLALFAPGDYQSAFPTCVILNGDMNNDNGVDFFDIDPFILCLFQGVCG